MSRSFDSSIPSDIRLLLRADAEQCWLSHEVIPVLQHLETRELLPDEEVHAALAYLEAMWDEAMLRAIAFSRSSDTSSVSATWTAWPP